MSTRNLALISVIVAGGIAIGWSAGGTETANEEAVETVAADRPGAARGAFGTAATRPSTIPVAGSDPSAQIIEQRAAGILAREAETAERAVNPPMRLETGVEAGNAPATPAPVRSAPTGAGPPTGQPGGWGAGQPAVEPGGWGAPRTQ